MEPICKWAKPLLAWCIVSIAVEAAGFPDGRFSIRSWTTDNQLPQNTINCVCQTRDGYLWIGTRSGLARFDGWKFTNYQRELSLSDPGDWRCRDLTEDTDGRLWIRTGEGLIAHQSGRFTKFSFADAPIGGEVLGFLASRNGGLWLAVGGTLKRFENGVVTQVVKPGAGVEEAGINRLSEDGEGRLWFRHRSRWTRFDPQTGTFEELNDGIGALRNEIDDLMVDRRGGVWVSTPGGLWCWAEERWSSYPAPTTWEKGIEARLTEDLRGDIWLAPRRSSRLMRFRHGQFKEFTVSDGLSDSDVRSIWPDREGSVWVGTGFGLNQLRPRPFVTMAQTNSSGSISEAFSVAPGANGRVWLGTSSALALWQEGRFTHWTNRTVNIRNEISQGVSTVLEDGDERLWFGAEGDGLYTLKNGEWASVLTPAYVKRREWTINTLFEDRQRRLWIGSAAGLIYRSNETFITLTREQRLSDEHILGVLQAPDGSYWIGTANGGVHHLENGVFKSYTIGDGLLSNTAGPLAIESDGTVWVGTPRGINRIRGGEVRSVTTSQGLIDNQAYSLIDDERGNFWAHCNRGVWRVKQSAMHAVADGRANWLNCISYGAGDGMLSTEGNGERQPCAAKSADGRLWFPTTRGVVVVDPSQLIGDDVSPPVVIQQVKANGIVVFGDGIQDVGGAETGLSGKPGPAKNSAVASAIRFPPGSAQTLEIRYTANSLTEPNRIRFHRQLEGADRKPYEVPSEERTVTYANLKPGAYRFHVTACNNHGVWNETGASVAFSIAPHVYETRLFYGLCGVAVVLTAAGIQAYRLSFQRKILRLEQQHALELERARIARDMHDDLGAGLTQLALLAELPELGGAPSDQRGQSSERVAPKVRDLLRRLNELVWAVNPKNDSLEGLVDYLGQYAENLLAASPIRLQLDVPTLLPKIAVSADVRHNFALVFKEALTNILKHSRATEVSVCFELEGSLVRCRVADNGVGWSGSGSDRKTNSALGGGNGLINMRQRIESLGGRIDWQSEPGQGTRVVLEVDLSKR